MNLKQRLRKLYKQCSDKHLLWAVSFLMLPSFLCAKVLEVVEYGDSTDLIIYIDSVDWYRTDQGYIPNIGSSYLYETGAPELPMLHHTFLFDEPRELHCKLIASASKDTTIAIAPSQGLLTWEERNAPRVKSKVYAQNAMYPSLDFYLDSAFTYRKKFGQKIEIYPFRYHPIIQSLTYAHYLKIRVYHPLIKAKAVSLIQNASALNLESMLLVAPDSLMEDLEKLVHWKEQIGLEMFVIDADTVDNLKSTVQYYYDEKNIKYLLLVGSAAVVPTLNSIYGAGDNNYGFVAGSDPYMDVFVGRWPVSSSTELSYIIDKTIAYESGDIDSLALSCLGIASNESTIGDEGETDLEHIASITNCLANVGFDSLLFSPSISEYVSISNAINNGLGLMCYAGHGDQVGLQTYNYIIDSLEHLSNTENHPFFIDVACLNGAFTSGSCFASEFILSYTDAGAVGGVGIVASTISQPWKPPMKGQDVMVDRVIEAAQSDTVFSLGEIVSDGFYEMINAYGDGGIETALTWNLFADPSLHFWSQMPKVLSFNCDAVYYVNEDVFEVESEEGSLISFSVNGKVLDVDAIMGGLASLRPGIVEAADSVVITAYKKGYVVAQRNIPLAFDGGAYYGLDSLQVIEDNGIIESGESVFIYPLIKNYGDSIGRYLHVKITHHSDFLSINDSVQSIDRIPAANERLTTNAFEVYIADDVLDMQEASITFEVTDGRGQTNTFSSSFAVKSPFVVWQSVSANEVLLNEEPYIVTTDSIVVRQVFRNAGHAPLAELSSRLHCSSPYVTVNDTLQIKTNLEALSSDTLVYVLYINDAIPLGESFSLALTLEDETRTYGFIAKGERTIQVGELSVSAAEYPFYNYYKNNKSQFILTAEELQSLTVIDSIGFYISAYPNASTYSAFNNLSISLAETSATQVGFTYFSGLTTVFSSISHTLPMQEGWVFFDIEDVYIAQGKNYVVEVLWGTNAYCTPYNYSYELMCHRCADNAVVYGYHDTQQPPSVRNVSRYRPTVRLKPRAESGVVFNVKIQRQDQTFVNDYTLRVGSQSYLCNALGVVRLDLFEGEYLLSASNGTGVFCEDSVSINDTTTQIILNLNDDFPVGEIVLDSEISLAISNDKLIIFSPKNSFSLVQIFDLQGRQLYHQKHHLLNDEIIFPFKAHKVYIIGVDQTFFKAVSR